MAKSCFVVSEGSMTQTCGTPTRLTPIRAVRNTSTRAHTHIYICIKTHKKELWLKMETDSWTHGWMNERMKSERDGVRGEQREEV